MVRRYIHAKGQAIVEFALAATLIFFLLAAAVDLGLIFFSVQGLHNAAQEGANYGSRWLKTQSGKRVLDEQGIRERVRFEAGARGGIGFVNLLDLNSNGLNDVDANETVNGKPLIEEYITIQALADPDYDGNPLRDGDGNPEEVPCENPATSTVPCYIRVTVEMDYNLVFALSPVFGDQIRLRSSYVMPLRDTAAEGGAPDPDLPPFFEPATRVPTPTNAITEPTPTVQPCEYSESSGIVAMQADTYMSNVAGEGGSWVPIADSKATGGIALMAGDSDSGVNTQGGTNGPRLDYTINFQTPGTYYVYVLGRAGPSGGGSNSVHVGLNGARATGASGLSGFTKGGYSWQNSNTTVTVSSAGVATLNIWMREDGTIVDRVVLSTSPLNSGALNNLNDNSAPSCTSGI